MRGGLCWAGRAGLGMLGCAGRAGRAGRAVECSQWLLQLWAVPQGGSRHSQLRGGLGGLWGPALALLGVLGFWDHRRSLTCLHPATVVAGRRQVMLQPLSQGAHPSPPSSRRSARPLLAPPRAARPAVPSPPQPTPLAGRCGACRGSSSRCLFQRGQRGTAGCAGGGFGCCWSGARSAGYGGTSSLGWQGKRHLLAPSPCVAGLQQVARRCAFPGSGPATPCLQGTQRPSHPAAALRKRGSALPQQSLCRTALTPPVFLFFLSSYSPPHAATGS